MHTNLNQRHPLLWVRHETRLVCRAEAIANVPWNGRVERQRADGKRNKDSMGLGKQAQLDIPGDHAVLGGRGAPVVANQTLARDRSIIPRTTPSTNVQLPSGSYAANDTGGNIVLYRLVFTRGIGNSVCSGFSNNIVVGACNPADADDMPRICQFSREAL